MGTDGSRTFALFTATILMVMALFASSLLGDFEERDPMFGDLEYVALGDSITYGFDGDTGMRMASPYPCLVAKKLGVGSHTNLAVSGATVSNINRYNNTMLQFADVPESADIISVMIGVNDFSVCAPLGQMGDMTQDTIYGGLYMLAASLQDRCPDAVIFFMTPFQFPGYPGENPAGYTLSDVADAVKVVCLDRGIPVLDMYTYGGFSMESDPCCDTLHPTQAFFRKYTAPMVSEFIRSLYG